MKLNLSNYILPILILAALSGLFSCANIIPPGGGPRDSLPPRLMFSVPKDSALNVNSNLITLTFDEYVQLQNVNDNLIISPFQKNIPLVDSKLRNVTVKLKDSLEKNTTYSINFGNAIKDVNEGNLAKELTYVFSTGKSIDSNHYRGYVQLAESGKIDSTLIVVLHKNLHDSSIRKNSPRYYAKLNGKGFFTFQFLPEGDFNAFVIPNDFTKKYDDSTKLFAFLNHPIHIGQNSGPDSFYVYQEFTKKDTRPSYGGNSSGGKANKLPPEDKRLKYSVNLDNGQQDLLGNLEMRFTKPLKNWDSSKIILYDSSYRPLTGYQLNLDTSKKIITLSYPWKEKNYFRIIIAKDAVTDTAGNHLPKSDSARFSTKREADYGSFRLRFVNLDFSKNPVLQLVQDNKIIESFPITAKDLIRKRYKPGEYEVRFLFDNNKNGVWDPGSYQSKKQPEIVQSFLKKLNIRADRDTDQTYSF